MRADTNGIRDAMNAVAVSSGGDHVFLYDRTAQRILRLDSTTGSYSPLHWDATFRRKRYICYALFAHADRLTVLFFKATKQRFCLITFGISSKDELSVLPHSKLYLTIESSSDQLAYCAQERAGIVELLFYDSRPQDTGAQRFWVFGFEVKTLKFVREQSGTLPTSMVWELPFVTENGLHFIHWRRGGGYLASWTAEQEDPVEWSVSDVLPDEETTSSLSRRAVWCNSWTAEFGIFVVSKKEETKTKSEVWLLDVRLSAWKHVATAALIDGLASNFAVRLVGDDLLLHCDLPPPGVPTFYRVRGLLSAARVAAAEVEAFNETAGIGLADVLICPICLDCYRDPKTLNCGHSLCNECLTQLAAKVPALSAVRCPTCRIPSKIPSTGLPTNFGLKEAIEMLQKVRRSQTYDKRCNSCRLACIADELWCCMDCDRGQTAICANCLVLQRHGTHVVRREVDFKVDIVAVEAARREFEKEASALFDRFKEVLNQKFQLLVFERIRLLHSSCLVGQPAKDAEVRAARCLNHFSLVFDEILKSTDSFIKSLEVSLFNDHECAVDSTVEVDRTTAI